MEDVVQGGWALVTGRGGGEAEAVAPLTSGEDVANIVEADLFQRLGEAGKGEAAPDSRPEGRWGGGAGSWGEGAQEQELCTGRPR